MSKIPPILLVGFGKMGGALLAGWRERGLAAALAVDPAMPESPGPEVTVVADAAATLPHYARFVGPAVFLSIMAGRTVAGIGGLLGETAAIVRAMPNTPAA